MSKNKKNPTIFVLDGSIRHYEDGSMLQLNIKTTKKEWEIIVEETIKYKVFLECLKETGCPLLNEPWNEEDDWYRLQLDIAVSRIRNIDPLLVAGYNQKELTKAFNNKMTKNAIEVKSLIEQLRAERKITILNKLNKTKNNGDTTVVSDL